jgi:uncharacterized membrane protein YkvA (DUF1232 family)
MKNRSKSMQAGRIPSEPMMSHFKDLSATICKRPRKSMTTDDFIKNQSRYMKSIDLGALRAFSSRLAGKLNGTKSDDYPGLAEAVHIIVQVLESPAARRAKDPLPAWLAETAFAAGYLLKGFDLIPDHFRQIGLADDALILRRVIERNQAETQRCLAECVEHAIG